MKRVIDIDIDICYHIIIQHGGKIVEILYSLIDKYLFKHNK